MKTIKVDIDKRIRNKFQLFLCGSCFKLFYEEELAEECCKELKPITEKEYLDFLINLWEN